MVSVKNGINSERVRSSPNANAIVDSFLIEFKRSYNRHTKFNMHVMNESMKQKENDTSKMKVEYKIRKSLK